MWVLNGFHCHWARTVLRNYFRCRNLSSWSCQNWQVLSSVKRGFRMPKRVASRQNEPWNKHESLVVRPPVLKEPKESGMSVLIYWSKIVLKQSYRLLADVSFSRKNVKQAQEEGKCFIFAPLLALLRFLAPIHLFLTWSKSCCSCECFCACLMFDRPGWCIVLRRNVFGCDWCFGNLQ